MGAVQGSSKAGYILGAPRVQVRFIPLMTPMVHAAC